MGRNCIILFCITLAIFMNGCIIKKEFKSSVAGVVLRDGKPAAGTVKLFDPANLTPLAESKTMSEGKFLLKDLPPGEWLIGLTSRTGGIIGNYHYIKVGKLGFISDFEFDVLEEDPKAKELMDKQQK